MKRQFFFHGNPSNGESTAINIFDGLEDKIHNDFFKYGASIAKSPYFLCEIKKWKDHFYSVYSYYHDGRDYSKRSNGHCILTLIVEDTYCRHTIDIYNLMVLVYETGLRDTLHYIDNAGNFLISSFYGKKELEYLQQDFYNRLDETQFREISSTFQNFQNTNDIETFNPNDVDSENFMKVWQRDGRVIITENRLSYVDNIISLEKENEKFSQQIISLKTQIENLSTTKGNHSTGQITINDDTTISKLKEENRNLANKIKDLERRENVIAHEGNSCRTSTLPPILQPLKDALHDWFPFIVIGLLIINIIGSFSFKQGYTNDEKQTVEKDSVKEEKDTEPNYEELESRDRYTVDSLNNVISTLKMFTDANIEIENIGAGNTIKKNKSYKWSIKDANGIYKESHGIMKVDGEIVDNPYMPKAAGWQNWIYYYKGIEVKHITIKVKN